MRQEIFEDIYQHNKWNSKESLSGPGSGTIPTRKIADAILQLVGELGIKSVLNIGCGVDNWLPELPNYVGVDISALAIKKAKLMHPGRAYEIVDAVTHSLPQRELVIVRDCLQHLPLDDGRRLLQNIKSSRASWLLASTFIASANVDIEVGGAYSPNLELEPFNLHNPVRLIDDGYSYVAPEDKATRDPQKKLALWSLP